MIRQLLQTRLLRFAMVGGAATLLQFALLLLFVELLSLDAVAASASAFALSAAGNYWLNYHFTFASRRAHSQTLPRFALVALCGLAINTSSFAALSLALHYLPAQVIATGVTLLCNFVLHQFWIYRRE